MRSPICAFYIVLQPVTSCRLQLQDQPVSVLQAWHVGDKKKKSSISISVFTGTRGLILKRKPKGVKPVRWLHQLVYYFGETLGKQHGTYSKPSAPCTGTAPTTSPFSSPRPGVVSYLVLIAIDPWPGLCSHPHPTPPPPASQQAHPHHQRVTLAD